MRAKSDPTHTGPRPDGHSFCLTNMSLVSLIACAIGLSLVLWLCVWAVL